MQICSKLQRFVKNFGSCQKGSIAVMYAVSAIPIFVAAGSAVDYIRYLSNVTELQAALDSAALAAASTRKRLTLCALPWLKRPLSETWKAVTLPTPQSSAALTFKTRRLLPPPTWTWQHR